MDIAAIVLLNRWQERLVVVDNPNTDGFRGLSLDPADLAVSKLAAGRPKDLDFVTVLLREGIITADRVRERIEDVPGLAAERKDHMQKLATRLSRG